MVKIKKSAGPGYYVVDDNYKTLCNRDGKFYRLGDFLVDFKEENFLFPTAREAKQFCDQKRIDASIQPEASIVDAGQNWVELHIGGEYAGDIFYRSPNVIPFEGNRYFVETPFSSTDDKYHVYELGRELEM